MLYFDKNLFKSLDYNLEREILLTNKFGGYSSTTLCGCNSRKYHGLIVSPIEKFDRHRHVLLSTLIESVETADKNFEISTIFSANKNSDGYRYITDFEYFPTPTITFECEEFTLKKELLKLENQDTLLIRYTLLRAENYISLKINPLLSFRDSHSLTHQNIFADTGFYPVVGGVKCRLYPDFPWLYMQTSIKSEYHYTPFWVNNVYYEQERLRGYQWSEDLLCNGYFNITLYQGESVILSCGTQYEEVDLLEKLFNDSYKNRNRNNDFFSCIKYSAEQFISTTESSSEIIAGFPWFDSWSRDTFISMSGLLLNRGLTNTYVNVLDTLILKMKDGLFPNTANSYNSADAPLWFFYALQRLDKQLDSPSIWRLYSATMKSIIENYIRGTDDGLIKMNDDGLIEINSSQYALTWMDAVIDGTPVTPRNGCPVEINALWYNALCYTMDKAELHREYQLTHQLKSLCAKVKKNFLRCFWSEELGYLYDYVSSSEANSFIRPNMIIAASLPYTMLDNRQMTSVFKIIKDNLLTIKGLRSLSQDNSMYRGTYIGDQSNRDLAYHNGTVWVWLLEHYVRAGFNIYGCDFLSQAQEIIKNFETDINSYGIATLPEIYDGDEPHLQRGAISQAWSIAAILEIENMIEYYSN